MYSIGTMSTLNATKINQLLSDIPLGAVLTSSGLTQQGYSYDLQKRYRKSLWLDSIGKGASVRHGETVDYLGAIYALQKQLELPIHPAAKTALSLLGKVHYLEFSTERVQLFTGTSKALPQWFKSYDWKVTIETQRTGLDRKSVV